MISTTIATIAIAFITAVIGPVVIEWVRFKIKKSSGETPMKEAIDLNKSVDDQLETLMYELGCDRIWITQFHNGGHFYPTGKSIQKFSIFYEKVSPNTESIQSTFQNIPVSLFPKSLSKLYESGEIAIHDFDIDENHDLNIFSKSYDCKSLYMIEIDDLNNRFIGVMGLSFNGKKHKLSKEEWIFIRQKVGAIGSLLTEYLNRKK